MRNILLALVCFAGFVAQAASGDGWRIVADDYSVDPYYGVVVGNGGIGILPWKEPLSVKNVVLNHVFDSRGENGISSVLYGLNPFNVRMSVNGDVVDGGDISGWRQCIDMRRGVFTSSFTVGDNANVSYDVMALRGMPYAGLITVRVEALSDIDVSVVNSVSVPKKSYREDVKSYVSKLKVETQDVEILRRSAVSRYRGIDVSASTAFLFENGSPESLNVTDDEISFSVDIPRGRSYEFSVIGTVCNSCDFLDPFNESDREVSYAAKEGVGRLMSHHLRLWDDLWQGDIEIEGDDDAQRAVRFSLYNLYSSCRGGSRLSIPPFGLSAVGYNGHVFWDTELWMYPPMLFLNEGIARSMMDYRTDRVDAACRRAMAYGYDGAMFPWESDRAGEETCPTWALTGAFEHHITADVAIAVWNYYCMTRDRRWLMEQGMPLLENVARFWVSRAERNDDGSYSIRNVVCADEYAIGVDDNAFTNGAVICALRAAVKAAKVCGYEAPEVWGDIADNIRIVTSDDGVTMEYEGYDGHVVKQADVNLLGYPLKVITDREHLLRDLAYYEPRINERGPAMSYAVLAVQYARLGDGNKAYELFVKSYRNNQLPPFGVVSEGAGGTNPYFTTGAGGFLQAVINGFAGLEITDKGVVQLKSSLPDHWKRVTVKGVGPERKCYTRK